MSNSIIKSFMDSGVVTEAELLFALHKTGKVDVVKFVKESVSNIKCQISEMSNGEAVEKLRETAVYFETMAEIIEEIDTGHTEACIEESSVVQVVGGE
jgi:hypothetical protein